MKTISYVMRKKENKYIITRYIFNNNKLEDKFWVNTYYNENDARGYFQIILDNIKFHNWQLIKKCFCKNIWEIAYI